MDTRTLQIFLKTVDYQNITRVAEEFNITQPAVSSALKRLEDETGCPLFIRRNKYLIPNEQGKIFYSYVSEMLNDVNHMTESIHGGYRPREEIFINMFTTSERIYTLMSEYRHTHPETGFVLRPYIGDYDDTAHFGLSLKLRQYVNNEQYVPIDVENMLYVIMNRNHPLARREQVHFSDIRNEDFVFIRSNTATGYEQSYDQCLLAGIVPHVALTVDTDYAKYAAINNGEWIGLAYNHELSFAPRMNSSVVIPVYAAVQGKLICLTYREERISPAEKEFVEYVRNADRKGLVYGD